MSATYQGNATNNSAAAAWAAATAHSPGDLVRPAPGTGQVFLCTVGGTTGSSQPSWSTGPFPTLGTTFTDNTVTWMCFGTEPGPWAPVIQLPVDTDPPLAFPQVIPQETMADQIAWVTANAGLLTQNNVWTGVNQFENFVAFTGLSGDTNVAIILGATPSTRKNALAFNLGDVDSTQINAHIYQDHSISSGLSDGLGVGLSLTVNAAWNGTQWAPDLVSHDSLRFVFGGSTFSVFAANQGGAFSDSAWGFPLLYLQTDTGGPNFTLIVPTSIDSTLDVSGAATLASAGVTGNATVGGTLAVTGAASLTSNVAKVDNVATAGQFGVNTTIASLGLSPWTGGASVALVRLNAPVSGFYRLEAYVEITTGSDTPQWNSGWTSADGTVNTTGDFNMEQVNTGSGGSTRPTYVASIVVWAKATDNLYIQAATPSSHFNAALSITAVA